VKGAGKLRLYFPQVNNTSVSGRARRESATRAMQGWHSQRLLGNGEIADPIIKVFIALESKTINDLHSVFFFDRVACILLSNNIFI
jgi:hypothetical protein